MAIHVRAVSFNQLPMAMPDEPIRRCTFRRVSAVKSGRGGALVYEVACLFPDRERPVPLGDLDSARATCNSCVAQGTFRPDSD